MHDSGSPAIASLAAAVATGPGRGRAGPAGPSPNLTLTLDRADLDRVMTGETSFEALAQAGNARLDGDARTESPADCQRFAAEKLARYWIGVTPSRRTKARRIRSVEAKPHSQAIVFNG
jgi:hypothetical protein